MQRGKKNSRRIKKTTERTSRDISLDEHVTGGHEVSMSVRVETRRGDHELHDSCSSPRGIKLVGWLSSATFILWVRVRVIPIDVTAVDKTAD